MKRFIVAALLVLAVHSTAGAQLMNADFELWDSVSTEKQAPQDWSTSRRGAGANDYFGTFQDSTSYHGRYALMVSRWYAYTWDMARQVVPTNERPGLLRGYYKYTDNDLTSGKDTAFISVTLTRWDPMASRRDTIGLGVQKLTTAAEYQPFTVLVTYRSQETPDTLDVAISPTVGSGQCQSGAWCSYLSVDDLRLESALAVAPTARVSLAAYPNPATNTVRIAGIGSASYNVTATDITGNTIRLPATSSGEYDLSGLPSGDYLLTVSERGVVIYQSAVVKLNP